MTGRKQIAMGPHYLSAVVPALDPGNDSSEIEINGRPK
jgi:hypothetical protein